MGRDRRLRLLVLLGFLGPLSDARAQPGTGGSVVAASPSDKEAFSDTVARYEDRLEDFGREVRELVVTAEAEERVRLDAMYGSRLDELNQEQDALRAAAITRIEAFLSKYPNSRNSAHAMFRLGDLYYELAEEKFLLDSEEYERMMADFDFDSAEEIPEAPQKDYGRSVALYRRIIADHPDYEYIDGAYYMLGFCLARDGAVQFDEEASRDVFQALVEQFPNSRFAAAAHLRLGEYYFDYNEVDAAIPHYEAVLKLAGPEGELYDEALYKLAWSHYKLSNYDQALTLFTELLDWSDDYLDRTGFESPTRPEAIEYTAISFSDLSDVTGDTPLEVAQAFYAKVGERRFEHDVYERLATVLTDQARFEDAIDAYAYLQQRWPDDPNNPTYQWRIAQIYYEIEEASAAQAAIAELTERYNDDSDWWAANYANPDALDVARGYIERSLAAVATGYHTQGLETGDVEALARAAELYGEYLKKFPFASDYYEIEWYRADTLMKTGQYEAAEAEYLQLLKADNHPYRDGALWNLMQVRRQRLAARYPSLDELPPDAVEEARIKLESGRERVVYALSEDHQRFIEAADQLLHTELTDPDYREALENNRVPLMYMIAQIYYHHGHYDEARPRLEELIQRYPEWDEAAYAASMMINSYQDEENLQKVQLLAAEYAGLPLGGGKKVREFTDLAEGAAFKLAEQLIQVDRLKAAQAFEQFMKDYPRSKYLTDAHYNAANSYEIAGRVEDANRLFKQYIDNIEAGIYPQDDRSRALYFRIASNYAEVLDLDNAIKYYEALYQRFPDYQDSAAALYNAAFLRIGLADHRGAATNFERYASLTPPPPDAEQVMFAAGAEWEKVGDREAQSFYRRYLRRYPDAAPDHVMQAYHALALIAERSGNRRAIDRAWEELGQAYARLAPTGKVGPRGRHFAAMAELRKLQAQYDTFVDVQYSRSEEQNVKLITEVKPEELKAIEARALEIVSTYGDFDASAAAIYFLGMGYLKMADIVYNVPPPKGFSDEELDIYYEELDRIRIPFEDEGRRRLEANLEKARAEKRWNEWVTRTLDELADRFPSDFATEKQELRGRGDSNIVPHAGLIPVELETEAAAESAEAAPATHPADAEPAAGQEGAQ